MSGSGGALDVLVREQIEVRLRGVGDPHVLCGHGGDVPALLLLVGTEQPGVETLLHHDERDARLVVWIKLKN